MQVEQLTGSKRGREQEQLAALKKQKTTLDQFKNPPSMESLLKWATAGKLTNRNTRKLVTINASATVAEAIKILTENKILSAPVVEEGLGFPSYRGFVDMFDILSVILKVYAADKQTSLEDWWKTYTTTINEIKEKSSVLNTVTVLSTLENPSAKYNAYAQTSSLSDVLAEFQTGKHRVAIGTGGHLVHILSQSTVLRFIAAHVSHLAPLAKRATVQSIGIGNQGFNNILKVNHTTPAIEAFYLLYLNKMSALPVVDIDGNLLANLSVSDLRGISPTNFASLLLPVLEYIASQVAEIRPPITVDVSDTFEVVLLKLAATGVHRLWVCNAGQLVGVISLTDVMKIIPRAYDPTANVSEWFNA